MDIHEDAEEESAEIVMLRQNFHFEESGAYYTDHLIYIAPDEERSIYTLGGNIIAVIREKRHKMEEEPYYWKAFVLYSFFCPDSDEKDLFFDYLEEEYESIVINYRTLDQLLNWRKFLVRKQRKILYKKDNGKKEGDLILEKTEAPGYGKYILPDSWGREKRRDPPAIFD
ncbi:MAG: hypothetical protein U9P44_01550 [archaeon]|nr:hypothetical protein [archaeon]